MSGLFFYFFDGASQGGSRNQAYLVPVQLSRRERSFKMNEVNLYFESILDENLEWVECLTQTRIYRDSWGKRLEFARLLPDNKLEISRYALLG